MYNYLHVIFRHSNTSGIRLLTWCNLCVGSKQQYLLSYTVIFSFIFRPLFRSAFASSFFFCCFSFIVLFLLLSFSFLPSLFVSVPFSSFSPLVSLLSHLLLFFSLLCFVRAFSTVKLFPNHANPRCRFDLLTVGDVLCKNVVKKSLSLWLSSVGMFSDIPGVCGVFEHEGVIEVFGTF